MESVPDQGAASLMGLPNRERRAKCMPAVPQYEYRILHSAPGPLHASVRNAEPREATGAAVV